MRQHWNHTIHQINTGTALQGLHIQSAVLLHIICHICNVYAKLPEIAVSGQCHCVIQILGILSVNGNGLPVSEVHTSCHIRRSHILCHTFCLIQHFFRKFHRKSIRPHQRHDIRTRIILMTDNLDDFAFRFLAFSTVRSQFYDYFMPAHGTFGTLHRNKNIHIDPWIIRSYKSEGLAFFKRTNHSL